MKQQLLLSVKLYYFTIILIISCILVVLTSKAPPRVYNTHVLASLIISKYTFYTMYIYIQSCTYVQPCVVHMYNYGCTYVELYKTILFPMSSFFHSTHIFPPCHKMHYQRHAEHLVDPSMVTKLKLYSFNSPLFLLLLSSSSSIPLLLFLLLL